MEKNKKTKIITIRMTENEYNEIIKAAKGLNRSKYIRNILLRASKEINRKEDTIIK